MNVVAPVIATTFDPEIEKITRSLEIRPELKSTE